SPICFILIPFFVCLPSASSLLFTVSATTEISALSLHDALPIFLFIEDGVCAGFYPYGVYLFSLGGYVCFVPVLPIKVLQGEDRADRKSTRLNSSHVKISYAVFCLKKKNTVIARKILDGLNIFFY